MECAFENQCRATFNFASWRFACKAMVRRQDEQHLPTLPVLDSQRHLNVWIAEIAIC